MTRFIVRVDDVGQSPEQWRSDVRLSYFLQWWEAGGWGDGPVYLGVVPKAVGATEIELLHELEETTGAEVCLHGWDHHPHELTAEDIDRASEVFPEARCVIPPYNRYGAEAIERTGLLAPPTVLFGGLPGEDHDYGSAPAVLGAVLHLSADRRLYHHSYQLAGRLDDIEDPGHPLVITLHHRWDGGHLAGVGELRRALEGRLATVDEARP